MQMIKDLNRSTALKNGVVGLSGLVALIAGTTIAAKAAVTTGVALIKEELQQSAVVSERYEFVASDVAGNCNSVSESTPNTESNGGCGSEASDKTTDDSCNAQVCSGIKCDVEEDPVTGGTCSGGSCQGTPCDIEEDLVTGGSCGGGSSPWTPCGNEGTSCTPQESLCAKLLKFLK